MKYIFSFLFMIIFAILCIRNVSAIPSPVFEFSEPVDDKKVRMAIVAACYKEGWELLPSGKSSINAAFNGYEICIHYDNTQFRIDYAGDHVKLHSDQLTKKDYVRKVNALLHCIDKELF